MRSKIQSLHESRYWPLIQALVVANCVSLFLFLLRVVNTSSLRYGFLFWNLLLAWLPLLIATLLVRGLNKRPWKSWQNVGLSLLWLGFLPNSFYIVSDLIHIHRTGEINILFDVVLFVSCIFNAYIFGFISLLLVHRELLRRSSDRKAHLTIGLVLIICSFAIYLGRFLRWNTWDIIIHPLGILFDVSDRIINPAAHPQAFATTVVFSLLLISMYWVIYEFVSILRGQSK